MKKTTTDKTEGQANVVYFLPLLPVKIDIDCMDPAEAKKLLPFKPHDQTSNQRLVYEQMISTENRELFMRVSKECNENNEGWEVVLDRMVSSPTHQLDIPTHHTRRIQLTYISYA